MRWYEVDPCYWIIRGLAAVGALKLVPALTVDESLPPAEQPWGAPIEA